jgi:hypothetical protein
LFYVFAAAVWASSLALIMLMQREGLLKGLPAVFAVVIVHGHSTNLPSGFLQIVTPSRDVEGCDYPLLKKIIGKAAIYFFSENFTEA